MKPATRIFWQEWSPLELDFRHHEKAFFVEELLAFTPKGKGNFILIKVQKVSLSTWEMIEQFHIQLGLNPQSIGYAGLKDKYATTIQYLTIPKPYSKALKSFRHKQIKILDTTLHHQGLKIGDVKANKFRIHFRDISAKDIGRIEKRARLIAKLGMPNYFGYQRFGKEEGNLLQAEKLIKNQESMRNKKLEKLLISAYQAHLFNTWLNARIDFSRKHPSKRHPFTLLEGDIFIEHTTHTHYTIPSLDQGYKALLENKAVPAGAMIGDKLKPAHAKAASFEKSLFETAIPTRGFRRPALIFPEQISCHYQAKTQEAQLCFTLPKSAYATVFLENITLKPITSKNPYS